MATTQRKTGGATGKGSTHKTAGHASAPAPTTAPKPGGQTAAAGTGLHSEHEDMPWTINIPDHPGRKDSPEYVKSRALMNQTATTVTDFFYGSAPYQDHHGGGLWLKDAQGWFMVKNVAGMEWSSQFCADPARVDLLRQNAQRLYALCPEAARALGIEELLKTPITDAAGVENWTDSICNASVPLEAVHHTGTLPLGGGVHHYPTPITDIQFFKHGDFDLWVIDSEGQPAAVTPVQARGKGDGRVRVVYSTPNTTLNKKHQAATRGGNPLVLEPDDPMAQQAYARQTAKKTIVATPTNRAAARTSKKPAG